MNTPDFLEGRASELMTIEHDAAEKRRMWAVILGLTPIQDGDQWCILWGADLQTGVAGFGETPVAAIAAFENEMYKKAVQRD